MHCQNYKCTYCCTVISRLIHFHLLSVYLVLIVMLVFFIQQQIIRKNLTHWPGIFIHVYCHIKIKTTDDASSTVTLFSLWSSAQVPCNFPFWQYVLLHSRRLNLIKERNRKLPHRPARSLSFYSLCPERPKYVAVYNSFFVYALFSILFQCS